MTTQDQTEKRRAKNRVYAQSARDGIRRDIQELAQQVVALRTTVEQQALVLGAMGDNLLLRERREAFDRELIVGIMREVSGALGDHTHLLEELATQQKRSQETSTLLSASLAQLPTPKQPEQPALSKKRARDPYGVGEHVNVWFDDHQRYFEGTITSHAGNDMYRISWHGDKRLKKNEAVILDPAHETRETTDSDRFHFG